MLSQFFMLQNNKNKNDFEARQNLVGFFHLLYKIDKRINPHLYENNGSPDNPNKSQERLDGDWERSFR